MKKNYSRESLLDALKQILEIAKESDEVKIGRILTILPGRGVAAFLIIFSLPFCIPITIPGLSTPFGIALGFLGLQIAFAHRPWWPKWVLEKSVKSQHIENGIQKSSHVLEKLQKILHPRLTIFTQNQIFRTFNGLLIFLLSIILALPLPIPLSNFVAALPILCFGLGLLENDGLFILIAYALVIICIAFIMGVAHLTQSYFA